MYDLDMANFQDVEISRGRRDKVIPYYKLVAECTKAGVKLLLEC
jgi:hypothetical protein